MLDVERRARRARGMAIVCTALGLAAMEIAPRARSEPSHEATRASSTPAAPRAVAAGGGPAAPSWVDADGALGRALVYPPRATETPGKAVTVLLHGMCGAPQGACDPFVDGATSRGWLVCPRAQDACGGGTRWRLRGGEDGRLVEASIGALAREHEGAVDASGPRVLVGFSLGGIAAVQIAEGASGAYTGLVVIASQVHPDATRLKAAGVRRVVLAAGDLDITSAPLQKDAAALEAQGVPTRFVSLGRFGHGYPPDMREVMREPMEWVAAASGAPGPS